jgi:hypothetical protein
MLISSYTPAVEEAANGETPGGSGFPSPIVHRRHTIPGAARQAMFTLRTAWAAPGVKVATWDSLSCVAGPAANGYTLTVSSFGQRLEHGHVFVKARASHRAFTVPGLLRKLGC